MNLVNGLILLFAIFTLWIAIGCKKKSEIQTIPILYVTTDTVTNINPTEIVSGGIITNPSNINISDRGVIWGIDSNTLVITSNYKISNGSEQSNFNDTIQNLQPNTTYYLRAYIIYSTGINYGTTVKFTTLPPQQTVYVAGKGGAFAQYWRDNVVIPFASNGYWSTWARSIFVNGEDVYAAGQAFADGKNSMAVYWKNGVMIPLTDGSNIADAYSIYVLGSDVYVAGYETFHINSATLPAAKYWKNGVPILLTDTSIYDVGLANSICVVGNDIYVAGARHNAYRNTSIATYWKNGIAISLNDSSNSNAEAQSILVKDNDVYVAGEKWYTTGIGGIPVAIYWKNGTDVVLTDRTQDAGASSIYVTANNDVYVAGYEYNGLTGYSVAKYWKNGAEFPLSDGNRYANASSIFVTGNNDVYVAGQESFINNNTYFHPKYWKNGRPVVLDSSTNDCRASSIYVK